MVRRQQGQGSIFELLLPDGDKLWDASLRRIDEVLEDEELIDLVEEALRKRWPKQPGAGPAGDAGRGAAADAGAETPLHWELRGV